MVAESRIISAFEYEQMPETDERTELIDGEVIVSAEPTPRHQLITHRLQRDLGNVAEEKGIGEWCPPLNLWISSYNVFGPDLLFFRTEQIINLDKPVVKEIPQIVVEILSPSTQRNDLVRKRSAYADRRIPEYWIIDPGEPLLTICLLDDQATYIEVPVASDTTCSMAWSAWLRSMPSAPESSGRLAG